MEYKIKILLSTHLANVRARFIELGYSKEKSNMLLDINLEMILKGTI